MEEKPSYYAILTADVRYDERLSSTEKLLYAEITSLCSKEGVCWASNNYFAKLYKLTPVHISRMIKKLCECGYIRAELEYKKGTREIKRRNIYLLTKMLRGININVKGGINKNVKENNINKNNINRIIPINNFSQDDLDNLYEN